MINLGFSNAKGIYLETENENILVMEGKNGYKESLSGNRKSLIFKLKKTFYSLIYASFALNGFIMPLIYTYTNFFDWLKNNGHGLSKELVLICFLISFISFFPLKYYSSFPQYHAAEHMVIKYIRKHRTTKDLTVNNLRELSRINYTCGTRFVIPSMTFYALFELISYFTYINGFLIFLLLIVLVLITYLKGLIPKWFIKASVQFSYFLQRYLTTKEPTDAQLELAIYAAKKIVPVSEAQEEAVV